MSNWEKKWKEFWLPILTTKGKLDEKKVKAEIHDFDFVIGELPKVYCHVTGSRLSKHMYKAETVIAAHDDTCHEYCVDKDDAVEERTQLFKEVREKVIGNPHKGKLSKKLEAIVGDVLYYQNEWIKDQLKKLKELEEGK